VGVRFMSEGELVLIAGGSGNKARESDTRIARSLRQLDDYIKRLQDQYTRLENRYWRQFSQLEVAMGKMNSQASYLFNQFNQFGAYG